ncbi:MAG: hypothetical protein FWG77_02925 [Treponema sp.]|nr:hypothetical protein [Treponema sp.]
MLVLPGCAGSQITENSITQRSGPAERRIHLFGEIHGLAAHVNRQLELWEHYYTNYNLRHLFLEMPYFTAEFLNVWMKEEDDDIIEDIFSDLWGTALFTAANLEFFRTIKLEFPETIFHGTDIGHQYLTTGTRFLDYLRQSGKEDSEQFRLTVEAIDQGRRFYVDSGGSHSLRVDMMVENFIREFDSLDNESIMSAFYGAAHASLGNYPAYLGSGVTMASRLRQRYGVIVNTTSLSNQTIQTLVGTPDVLFVGGKEYTATYFGGQNLSARTTGYLSREFWRLENAYDDFKDNPLTGELLPFNNYPMLVETGQVFAVLYVLRDGSDQMMYYRAGGRVWRNIDTTEEFIID